MHLGFPALSQWEQSGIFDPTNPNQQQVVQYAQIPGGYGSWYYNRIPVDQGTALKGALGIGQIRPLPPAVGITGLSGWSDLSSPVQAGIAVVAGAIIGYFGWKRFGSDIKSKVKSFRK